MQDTSAATTASATDGSADNYEAPRVDLSLSADEVGREIHYAAIIVSGVA